VRGGVEGKVEMTIVEGWKTESLGDQLKLIRNGYSGQQVSRITDFPVTRIETISDGTIDLNKVGYVDFIPDSYRLKSGDLLFSNINSLKHIGKVARVSEETRLFHGMNLLVLRPVEQVDDKFLFYKLINAKPWFEKMAAQAINQASINQVTLKDLQLEIPVEKPEQTKIADILSTVDRAIEQSEALIAKQQRIKTGLMQDLLIRGIDEHGNLRSEQTHKFKDSSIKGIRIPKSWKDCTFRHVTKVSQGLQIPIEERFKEDGSSRYKYITVQYLNNPERYLEFIENPPPQLVCNIDDILFTRTGNTGQIITDVEGVYHNNFFKIAYDKKSVRKDYLIHFLNWQPIQDMIIELAGTTTIPDLNHGDFYALSLFLPESDEQKNIDIILAKQNVEIHAETFKLNKYKSLKSALMQVYLRARSASRPC
jgi:type I restriction enzyme S subunit